MPSMPLAPPMTRRKKWTEDEELALIGRYGELQRSGFLARMKTRQRKFDPIAEHVNGAFHAQDPVTYPWQWSWKDVSTKVQNMRHQYLGVKQKVRRVDDEEEFDWEDGVTYWPNFLKYKEVFGDQDLDIIDNNTPPQLNNTPSLAYGSRSSTVAVAFNGAASSSLRNQPQRGFLPSSRRYPSAGVVAYPSSFHRELGMDAVVGDGSGLVVGENGTTNNSLLAMETTTTPTTPRSSEAFDVTDEPGNVLGLGLGFEYVVDGEDEGVKTAGEEPGDDEEDSVDLGRRKKRRRWRRFEGGSDLSLEESRLLSFFASQLEELRERDTMREACQEAHDRERRRALERETQAKEERESQMQQWEMDRNVQEQLWRQETEEREKERDDEELKLQLLFQRRQEEERERERVWEERRERERIEWKERMLSQQLSHHARMVEMQSQITESHESSNSLLLSLLVQVGSEGQSFFKQGSLSNSVLCQLLQNLQPSGNLQKGPGDYSER